ncbi:MAG: SDR family NAD(P)-dependent oxidoreductase [Myxococcales bacterium]|nr:SDR family NAD(P)-dependent oxidoreductase [Myxococcales bacterium]
MDERIAIVTGANRGLGLRTCEELLTQGYRVVLTARDAARAEAAAASLREAGLGPVEAATLDVSSESSVAAFAEHTLAALPRVDVLVNNAGAIFETTNDRGREGSTSVWVVPAQTVLDAVNTNAMGAYRMLQRVLPRMNDAGYGRVVNVSSGMGALTDMGSGWPAYRISKTALHAVTRLFHNQARGGVKVNAVCPGWVRTDMGGAAATRSIPEGAAGIVLAATLAEDGPSGVLMRDGKVIDW